MAAHGIHAPDNHQRLLLLVAHRTRHFPRHRFGTKKFTTPPGRLSSPPFNPLQTPFLATFLLPGDNLVLLVPPIPCTTEHETLSECASHSTSAPATLSPVPGLPQPLPTPPPSNILPVLSDPHGMPSAYAADLSPMTEVAQNKAQQHGVAVKKHKKDPAVCPTDDEAVMPQSKTSTRSWDYVWRSGVAGGFAGCAVSFNHARYWSEKESLTCMSVVPRRKPSSRRSIESRFCSRRATHSLPSTPAPPLARRWWGSSAGRSGRPRSGPACGRSGS